MADPEGFLNSEDNHQNYLDGLVGGPEAMRHADQIGSVVADSEVRVDVDDQSGAAETVPVRAASTPSSYERPVLAEASTTPFDTQNPNYNPTLTKT